MRKKSLKYHYKYRNYLLRWLCLLFAGLLINIAVLFSTDTFSWFNGARTAGLQVNAVATEDIVEYVSVLPTNPSEIRIKKAENFGGDAVLYFAIEGEALEYLAHINPVRLDTGDEMSVSLTPRVELPQFMKLLTTKAEVTGKLKIKYLNEFIDEEVTFTYSNEYLLGCFINTLQDEDKSKDGKMRSRALLKGETSSDLSHLLHYVIDQTGWEAVSRVLEARKPIETKPVIENENRDFVDNSSVNEDDNLEKDSDDIKENSVDVNLANDVANEADDYVDDNADISFIY